MTKDTHAILVASEFVSACAETARTKGFHRQTVGAEMLKHGYALLTDLPLDVAERAVRAMLTLYEKDFVDVPPTGSAQ